MINFTDENFDKEVLQSRMPVLVDFWAPWCGPCLMAGPVIEELAKDYEGKMKFGKLNVDENPKISQEYGIMSIPTVIIFNGKKEVNRLIGFPGKSGYEGMIKEVLDLEDYHDR